MNQRRLPTVPGQMPPGVYGAGIDYQLRQALAGLAGALGQTPQDAPGEEQAARWRDYEKIPAFYPVAIELGGEAGNVQSGSAQLRPEPFILKRITWAASGDVYPSTQAESGFSLQGRAVTVEWSDEFTKFLGNTPTLISALFGDSNGFLDIPRGALFQGKQSLSVKLTRLFWPSSEVATATRFDFVFQGIALLPKNVGQSGSAG